MNRKIDRIPYRKDLIEKARFLRKNSTPGEIEVWNELKSRKLAGYKFRRQHPVHRFILDFYCKELKLAIEIDGVSHDYQIEYDKDRQELLETFGISFLRFSESDAKHHTESVIIEINKWIEINF